MLFMFMIGIATLFFIYDYLQKKHRVQVFAKSHITGPDALPIFGSGLEVLNVGAENIIQYIGDSFEKYGKTFRLWILNEAQVFTIDVKKFELILTSTTLLKKGDVYNLFRPWLRDGLLLSIDKKWHDRRKVFTPAFHFGMLENFVDIFDEQSTIMAKKLEPVADGRTVVDMFGKVCLAALDVVTEAAMGVKVNAQLDPEFPYVKALKSVVYIQPDRILKVSKRYDWIFKLTSPFEYRKLMRDIKTMHDFTIKVIEERRKTLERSIADGSYRTVENTQDGIGSKRKMALLDILLQSKIGGTPLTNENICEEVDTFMFEGDDTTTSGVSHALYCISRHPQVQQKLYDEIVSVMGNDKNVPITMQHLQNLKYMECVIKETLRMHPPVPAIGRKVEKDLDLDGVIIPANTSIYLVIYWAHRDPSNFPYPNSFKPERFSEENERAQNRNPFNFTPFSAGPRNCIGQKFAILEMKAMISKMLRYYELLPMGPEIIPMMNFILRSSVGVNIGLKKRV